MDTEKIIKIVKKIEKLNSNVGYKPGYLNTEKVDDGFRIKSSVDLIQANQSSAYDEAFVKEMKAIVDEYNTKVCELHRAHRLKLEQQLRDLMVAQTVVINKPGAVTINVEE